MFYMCCLTTINVMHFILVVSSFLSCVHKFSLLQISLVVIVMISVEEVKPFSVMRLSVNNVSQNSSTTRMTTVKDRLAFISL